MTLSSLIEVFDIFQHSSTLLIIAGTVALMSMTVTASAHGSIITRSMFLIIVAFGALALYSGLDDLNGDYFLNLSTEIIGAVIMLVILSEWVLQYRWTFLVVAAVILVSTLTIEVADTRTQPFMLNLTTELLGAFLLLVLLQRRDWIWNSGKRIRDKRIRNLRHQRNREVERIKEIEKQAMMDEIASQLDAWREKEQTRWDIGMIVAGKSTEDVKAKLKALNTVVRIVSVRKDYADADLVQCYVICSTRNEI